MRWIQGDWKLLAVAGGQLDAREEKDMPSVRVGRLSNKLDLGDYAMPCENVYRSAFL